MTTTMRMMRMMMMMMDDDDVVVFGYTLKEKQDDSDNSATRDKARKPFIACFLSKKRNVTYFQSHHGRQPLHYILKFKIIFGGSV